MFNKCLTCGKDVKNKFCNRSCAAKTNNKLFKKRTQEGSCKKCGLKISSTRIYCKTCFNQKECNKTKLEKISGSKRVVSWRQRIKIKAIAYKGGCCCKCGYNKCVRALQFHHVNRGEKEFSISGVSRGWGTIKKELDKCVLLCANCHAEEHDDQQNHKPSV